MNSVMVRTEQAALRKEERTERRRKQILDAARSCFCAEGFHAASMSRVAAVAGMSVGHIYQYFENKESIITALCERDFEEFMLRMPRLAEVDRTNVDAMIDAALADFGWLLDRDRAILTLEVLAEATRNPKVAEVTRRVDTCFRAVVHAMISPLFQNLRPADIDARVETLILLVHGLAIRVAGQTEPNYQVLAQGYRIALRGILSPQSEG